MITEVVRDIYQIQIPLPNNPLKNLNSYLVKGKERNLVIDTGFNHPVCLKALTIALGALNIRMEKTDFFITHLHADHSGLVGSLLAENSTAYMSEIDAHLLSRSLTQDEWEQKEKVFQSYGFPEKDLLIAEKSNPAKIYLPSKDIAYKHVSNGETIQIGEYSFSCLATPGHTPGHMCLYDDHKRLLISGDHILDEITPNITIWQDAGSPLGQYLESLDSVKKLKIDIVLSAHRRIIRDCHKRIEEIKQHHQNRLNEILVILAKGEMMTAYQVAAEMSWSLSYKSWSEFPPAQKWFAVGEAIAHLEYLVENKKIQKSQQITKDGKMLKVFSQSQ